MALTAGSLALNGSVAINITQLAGTTISAGTYNLLTFTGGTSGSGSFYLNDPSAWLPSSLVANLNDHGQRRATYYHARHPGAWPTGKARRGPELVNPGQLDQHQAGHTAVPRWPASVTDLNFATAGGTATVDQNFTVNSLNLSAATSGDDQRHRHADADRLGAAWA